MGAARQVTPTLRGSAGTWGEAEGGVTCEFRGGITEGSALGIELFDAQESDAGSGSGSRGSGSRAVERSPTRPPAVVSLGRVALDVAGMSAEAAAEWVALGPADGCPRPYGEIKLRCTTTAAAPAPAAAAAAAAAAQVAARQPPRSLLTTHAGRQSMRPWDTDGVPAHPRTGVEAAAIKAAQQSHRDFQHEALEWHQDVKASPFCTPDF
jgi:hypothetical protein